MFVSTGTRLTWVGYFDETAFSNQNVTDAIQAVSSGLRNKYNLVVESAAPDAGLGSYVSGAIALQLRSDMDRGNGSDGSADIGGNVADEFALTGNACNSYRVNPPASGGAPAVDTSQYDACSGISDKIRNALPTWLGGTPVTEAQQACYTQRGQASVQQVATSAASIYGAGSATAQATAAAANVQAAGVAADTTALSDAARKAAASHDQTILYVALGVGAVIVIIVALVAVK